jgi:hypothetical protein
MTSPNGYKSLLGTFAVRAEETPVKRWHVRIDEASPVAIGVATSAIDLSYPQLPDCIGDTVDQKGFFGSPFDLLYLKCCC